MKIFLIILFLSILILSGFTYYYINEVVTREIHLDKPIEITIPHNTSGEKALKIFNDNGLLQPNWIFKLVLKYFVEQENSKIYAGTIKIQGKMTNLDILKTLFDLKFQENIRVTILEGLRLEEVAQIFSNSMEQFDSLKFMELTQNNDLLIEFDISADNILGYLLPDTYDFFKTDDEEKIIRKLLTENKKIWNEKRLKKLEESKLTKHEVLTIASIVEAETPLKAESKTVAGLYLNRVKKGMLLQADPTVQFVLGKKQRVLYKHLEIDNPYNTYVYPGLPPGPINNPGLIAIDAVLNPEQHDYLYMVSMGDGSGKHYFSKNHREHLSFVEDYRKTRDSIKTTIKYNELDTIIQN
jgi:UPF0755 protein